MQPTQEPNRDKSIEQTERYFALMRDNLDKMEEAFKALVQGDQTGATRLVIYTPAYQKQAEFLANWLMRFIAVESIRTQSKAGGTGQADPFESFINTLPIDSKEEPNDHQDS